MAVRLKIAADEGEAEVECGLPGSYDAFMATSATVLYWKLEDVPVGDGESPHPADVGPAWIYQPDGSEEPVHDGEWITRTDAQRIAGENGYELQVDDGFE